MKIKEKTPNGLYEGLIISNKRKTLEEIVEGFFSGKRIFPYLDIKWPIERFFIIKDRNYIIESEELDKLRVSDSIYRELKKFIYEHMSKEERDIFNLYKTYGSMASFPYDIDEKRRTSVPKEFKINTPFGLLSFKFSERTEYGVPNDYILAYDDDENVVILFVEQGNYIRTEDLINILRRKHTFIHEFSHYIDKINAVSVPYISKNDIEYLNDPNEIRANTQMLIYTFGSYLFKNKDNFKTYNLKKKEHIKHIFEEIFLKDEKNNVVDKDDLSMMRKEVYYLYPKNKEKFYNTLYKYIIDEYGTNEDINYKESHSKNNLIRLLRLEEKVYKDKELNIFY